MKRQLLVTLCVVVLLVGMSFPARPQSSPVPKDTNPPHETPATAPISWTSPPPLKLSSLVGERLDYLVSWADYLVAARVTMEVKPANTSSLPEHLQLRMQAQTVGVVKSIVMALDDQFISSVESLTALPSRYEKRIREGTRHVDATVVFDHQLLTAQIGEKKIPIEAETRDIVSFWYFMRTLDLSSGKQYRMNVLTDDKVMTIVVSPEQKSVVDAGAGAVEAIGVALRAEETQGRRKRINDDYQVRVWLSNDEKRTPVLITAKPPFGDIRVKLVKPES